MTKEEKINTLKAIIQECEEYQWQRKETLFEIIKALEQEPCEDAISRADAVKVASGYCHPQNIANELAKLPPITPQPKTGHWIDKEIRGSIEPYCSVCGDSVDTTYHYNYCPNCGARMQEGEETK